MYKRIVEADLYRLQKQKSSASSQLQAKDLDGLIAEKRKLLLDGEVRTGPAAVNITPAKRSYRARVFDLD